MELSGHRIKKVLIFFQKWVFSYFGKWNFLRNLLIFQEGTFTARKRNKFTLKNFLYFSEKLNSL